MLRPVALLALLLTALVAGCADPPSGGDGSEPEPEAFQDVEVTETTGAIRGVVVSEAIVPIPGVVVQLVDGANQTTDEEGAFVFNGLAPGDYFVSASKAGYISQQQAATVVAGEEPPITKILLPVDPGALSPFFQEYVFDGYIQCSLTGVAVSFAACSAINIFAPVTDDRFGVTYELASKPSWIQTEMIWDSTQAAGGEMTVQYSWDCGDENGGFLCDYGVGGKSPLILRANETAIAEINEGEYNGTELFIRSFNQGLEESDPDIPSYGSAPGGGVGLTLNQQFTYYTHIFYGYEPPADWVYSVDSTVPQPPK